MNYSALASGDIGSSYAASKAVDGTTSTMWNCGYTSGSTWWGLHFASAVAVDQYTIAARNDSYLNDSPTAWTVQGSNDGSSWTTIQTQTSPATWTAGLVRSFSITTPVSYSYLRFLFTGVQGGAGHTNVAMSEVTLPNIPFTPGPHRYWRINIGATNGGDIRIAELELSTSLGGANETGSGTAGANNAYFGHLAAAAFDGDPTTSWSINSGWLSYDFGSGVSKEIVEARVACDVDTTTAPKDFSIEYSDDNSNWTSGFSLSSITGWYPGQRRAFSTSGERSVAPIASAARYWRLLVTASNGGDGTSVSEIELFMAGSGADQTGAGSAFSSPYTDAPANAFDNSFSTKAGTNGANLPYHIYYDFGSGITKDISIVSIRANSTDATLAPKNFLVQRSSDKIGWSSANISMTNVTSWSTGQLRYFNSSGETTAPVASAARPQICICT